MGVNLNFCTVAANVANNDATGAEGGGGLLIGGPTVALKNTVFGDNSVGSGGTGPDIYGTVISQNYNHIEDLSAATILFGNATNTTGDAVLGYLSYNGGQTLTHLPGVGSILINSIPSATNGCGNPVNSDQRGAKRPAGGNCDKGSVEQ
jgi:hypothetical protein